ncbi:cation:proton antiporter domain-containing protein [Nocardiopsis lucentensis]|uniref:cation:proton antiporter domain-containing protein n=1 Tax=Nocardiopsis lucentensis TaxID=53441 RepID=UPI00034D8C1D|nr:cation:proton antiporter [Nocardiopsis lucentensis]
MMLAAGETPVYLGPIVALLVAAGLIGALFVRLRVVPIVGFLLAGVLIGPHQLGVVADEAQVEAAADIGVMLLLFTIGVEFSIERLGRIKRFVLGGGTLQVALTTAVVSGLCLLFGLDWRVGVFTGFLVALSSTAIVLKVIAAKGITQRPVGQASVGTLILQDLAIVVMVLLIPILGGEGDGTWGVVQALGTAALVLTAVIVVARKVMPPLLERIARLCSPEIFLLSVVAIALGVAYLTSLAGVSNALGAFLAGMVLSESRHSAHALSEIMPLQMIFSAVFFVSVGMLLDVSVLAELWWMVLIAAIVVVVVKVATTFAAVSSLRVGARTAIASAFMLAQIGEFSFVLQRSGAEYGLSPAGMGPEGDQLLVAVTVALMTLTPALGALGEAISHRLPERAGAPSAEPAGKADDTRDRVLLSGWGPVARNLGAYLNANGVPSTVTTLSPDLAADAEGFGHTVVRGEVTKASVLHEIDMDRVRLIVIAENSSEEATHIAHILNGLAPGVPIVVRPTDSPDIVGLYDANVQRIVDPHRAATEPLGGTVLDLLGIDHTHRGHPDPTVVTRFSPDPDAACAHMEDLSPVLPKSPGCTDCLRRGRRDWVHLRICAGCGFVGCCDDSPDRHASAHATAFGHPVMFSAEPGDDWAWCVLDSHLVHSAETPAGA